MKKNFIIYIFIIFLLSYFNIFAEREVDIDKIKYDESKKELFSAYRLNGVGTGYTNTNNFSVSSLLQ